VHLWRHATTHADEVARYLFRRVVTWGRSSNVFLRNGSRIYLDVGSHPEYATAECDDLVQLINHDRAGERILEDLIVDAEHRLASEGITGDIYLFKNNTDSHGNSYGCHENYLISRIGDFSKITDVLVPFLVSRQLICGAGKVLHTARGAEYSVSQRAEHIWESVSSATTRSRPIINTRDEPHADPERYRRLHVIVGDSNMSETTTLLKVGSAELVLRLIEAGVPMRDYTLENPIRAIRDMSRDRSGQVKVALSNGRRISALELQTEYYEKVSEFVRRESLGTRVVDRVLDLWRTLRAVAEDKLALIPEIDWAIKRKLLDRYAFKHKLSFADPRIFSWIWHHDIQRREGVLPARAARTGHAGHHRPGNLSGQAVPPQTAGRSFAATSFARRRRAGDLRSTGSI
jgi:proteasome accessory factor A